MTDVFLIGFSGIGRKNSARASDLVTKVSPIEWICPLVLKRASNELKKIALTYLINIERFYIDFSCCDDLSVTKPFLELASVNTKKVRHHIKVEIFFLENEYENYISVEKINQQKSQL